LGKVFGIFIAFLGVGMVAIPTGIISAGFVEQYSRIKRMSEYADEEQVRFIKIRLSPGDRWAGTEIRDLGLPKGVVLAVIQRGKDIIVPRGDVQLRAGDTLVLGAESLGDDRHIDLKELLLRKQHPWNGQRIRELDISRQTIIVLIKRKGKGIIPYGDLVLREGDRVILYTQTRMNFANHIEV
jgi:voltage-gated potassium channel